MQSESGNTKHTIDLQKVIVKELHKLSLLYPNDYLFSYDVELGNLAAMLQEAGDFHQAFDVIQKALLMDQILIKKIEKVVALSLKAHNLILKGEILSKLGNKQEALAITREAVEIDRNLSKKYPDIFGRNLPFALDKLALRLDENGKQLQALEREQEAISLHRKMAHENSFHLMSLAIALGNLGRIHLHAAQPEKAFRSYTEALRTIVLAAQKESYIHPSHAESLLKAYLQTCKKTKKQPDEILIKQIKNILQKIREKSEDR